MMDNSIDEFVKNALDTFSNITKKPEIYLSVQENKALQIRTLLKDIYDFTKSGEDAQVENQALHNLIIQDFDEEQIWQQLELQNDSLWPHFITDVSKLYSDRNNLQFHINNQVSDEEYNIKDESEISEEEAIAEIIEDEKNNCNDFDDFNDISNGYSDSSDDSIENNPSIKENMNKIKKSVVDDKFFKLSELEHFLNQQDRIVMNEDRPNPTRDSGNEESDASIDLFDDLDSKLFSNEEDEDADDEEDHKKYPKYADFFDAPEGEINKNKKRSKNHTDESCEDDGTDLDLENSDVENKDEVNKKKSVRFQLSQDDSSDDDDDDDDENDENEDKLSIQNTDNDIKSAFEIRQERLKKKIGHLEKAALEPKPWQLKGEIDADNRPQNSLLEEIVEFDLTSRPAPIITQETTLKLEDIIRRRIKDKSWDDVERKAKPVDTPLEYKKKLILNQEKSKESLAQIYEQEYLKQKEALDPEASEKPEEEPKEHLEIREMMTSLFAKLDALSNFHYTPRPVVPEVKIVTNLPAISMEEVAPVSTSDAALLAPQEVQQKTKGDIIGKDERTDTDKKRERRQKKLKQRNKEHERQQKEKMLHKLNPGLGNKYSKQKSSKLVDKLSKDRNIEKMDIVRDGKSMKSSQAFFTQLQEQVQGQISSKIQGDKKRNKDKITAKRVKL